MLKKLVVVLSLSVALFSFNSVVPSSNFNQARLLRTLVIDPGHGGIDPGAIGTSSTEAEIALNVSMKLGKIIQEEFPDLKIVYTRTSNVLPGNLNNRKEALRYRADLANRSKGDLFISIHCNAAGKRPGGWYEKRVKGYTVKTVSVGKGKKRRKVKKNVPLYENVYVENKARGTETYVWAADRSGLKGENINADEGGENVEDSANILDFDSPEARIRQQLYTKLYFSNSYRLAQFVEDEFTQAGRASRGVKQRNNTGIWVLQATGMPSVLVELGYITNTEEERYLNSSEGQGEMVDNLLNAFKRYKKGMETSPKAK
ncbi:MAG: N-acetylmuramoyl-L-alanine amidase [Chitinophagaceae bacterium]|nr:N-acetylmuramoyl-L-alanine amidase [Chitinophagaceae bacterium]